MLTFAVSLHEYIRTAENRIGADHLSEIFGWSIDRILFIPVYKIEPI